MREIKFRGTDMNGRYVYGLLTKKKIRSNGQIRWAIATGNCSAAETIPIRDNFAQLIAVDKNGNEVYERDKIKVVDTGGILIADFAYKEMIEDGWALLLDGQS